MLNNFSKSFDSVNSAWAWGLQCNLLNSGGWFSWGPILVVNSVGEIVGV